MASRTILTSASRWIREGPFAGLLPWRLYLPLERATAALGIGPVPPIRLSLSDDAPESTLLFGGDLALHRWDPETDIAAIFGGLAELTSSADGSVVNLETQLTSRATPPGILGSFLRASPQAVQVLRALGLSAVSCANNHCLDFGPTALAESLALLGQAGIGVVGVRSRHPGAGGSLVLQVRGLRVGLLGLARTTGGSLRKSKKTAIRLPTTPPRCGTTSADDPRCPRLCETWRQHGVVTRVVETEAGWFGVAARSPPTTGP